LYWKTECEEGACLTSSGDNIFTQEDSITAATDSEEIITYEAEQEDQLDEISGITYRTTQPVNMENFPKVNNSQLTEMIRTSRRQKKPPRTRKEDFLW
jgi:hypothetical protein